MDFTLDEETLAVKELAGKILGDYSGTSTAEADGALRIALGEAGLLGLHLSNDYDGNDLPIGVPMALLEEQGRVTGGVPLWPLVAASFAIARFASVEERGGYLPEVVTGSTSVTVALEEFDAADPLSPTTRATKSNGSWTLTGTKAAVPVAGSVRAVVVSAADEAGPGLFLVDADVTGLQWQPTSTTDNTPTANLQLQGAKAILLGDQEALQHVLDVAILGICATQLGVMQGALMMAATHLSERHQFGRPLATFQAVQHALADCYIDIDASRVTLWQALSDVEDAAANRVSSVPVAQWWAARAGLDVVHRTQHLHGGTGVDRDFDAHRFYLWARQLAGTLGNQHTTLARLGDHLVASGVQEGETA